MRLDLIAALLGHTSWRCRVVSIAMHGADANGCEWHLVVASAQQIEAVCAEPRALYTLCADVVQRALHLSERSAVVLHGGLHWLLSEEIPGDAGPITPLVFLDRGGIDIELRMQLVFEDNTRSNIESARYFLPHARQAILDAITSLDQEALLRKGGAPSFAVVQALRLLLAADPSTWFVVSHNVCFVVPKDALPVFAPPLARREKQRDCHVAGALPTGVASNARAIGGDTFVGFGTGPALALSPDELASCDLTRATTAVGKFLSRAQSRGEGIIAYQRLASWESYGVASFWLRLGYFDADEVVEQLEEELEEELPHEVIERVVAATAAILTLDQAKWPDETDCDRLFAALDQLRQEGFLVFEYAGFVADQGIELACEAMEAAVASSLPYCFFHQQCILHALDGEVFSLYFGEATRDAAEVATRTSKAVGDRIAGAMTSKGLRVEWDGDEQSTIQIRLMWQCRPRRGARALP